MVNSDWLRSVVGHETKTPGCLFVNCLLACISTPVYYSLQSTVYSLQSTVHSLQSAVYSLQSTIYSPQSTVCSLQSAVYILQSTLHRLQSAVYSLQSRVYSPQSTLYSLQSTVYSLQSTLYSLQSAGPPGLPCSLWLQIKLSLASQPSSRTTDEIQKLQTSGCLAREGCE